MPKDPSKNINRYKIRGGQLNTFEYQKNQDAVSHDNPGNDPDWPSEQAQETDLPPHQANAERIRKLLISHGESVSGTTEQAEAITKSEASVAPPATGKTPGVKRADSQKGNKQASAGKTAKKAAARKKADSQKKTVSPQKAVSQKASSRTSDKRTKSRKATQKTTAGQRSAGKAQTNRSK